MDLCVHTWIMQIITTANSLLCLVVITRFYTSKISHLVSATAIDISWSPWRPSWLVCLHLRRSQTNHACLELIHFFVVFTVLKVKSYNKNYSHPFLCVVSAYCRYLHIIIVISLWNIRKSSDVRRQAQKDQDIMIA